MSKQPATRLRSACARGAAYLLLAAAPPAALAGGEVLREVVFSDYAEHSSNAELARRLLSPLTALRLERQSPATLAGQPVNLATERYLVYVPPQHPARGFALLVFVPPWQDARLPPGWARTLDESGTIFVSAARSGNDESAMGRREPLALLAADNIPRRYPVDPERVYIAGFSGGSRVALRLALGYPDVFRGALLNAGSDPIGSPELPLPPKDLFSRFQSASRLVYLTGERDTQTFDDMASIRSLHQWCVFNIESRVQPRVGHEVADAAALAGALGSLMKEPAADSAKRAACRSGLERELAVRIEEVEALLASGRTAAAHELLNKVDERYGGLAAPRSVELARPP